jgi:hypothetical protein
VGWIRLTDLDGRYVWVNLDRVETMVRNAETDKPAHPHDAAHTELTFVGGHSLAVAENPELIFGAFKP